MKPHPILLIVLLLVPLLVPLAPPARASELETAHDATVRLTDGEGGRGTGTVFECSQGQVWIVTCAHVATTQTLQAEFYSHGHQSSAVPAAVLWRHEGDDVAIVRVAESALGGVSPPVVPFAPPDHVVAAGARLRTAGSALGVWPTSFVGHAVGYQNGDLLFRPAPANGRSGSAILDDTGRIVGIVRARAHDNSHGLATPIQAAYRLWGSAEQKTAAAAVQMPTVPAQQPFRYQLPLPGVQRRQYLDGYRQGQACPPGQTCPTPQGGNQAAPQGGSGGLWPTLPSRPQSQPYEVAPVPSPQPSPGLDLGALGGMVDQFTRPIADSLERIEGSIDSLAQEAEQRRQDRIRDELPLDELGEAGGAALQRDWTGAGAALTGPAVGAWAAGGIAALLAGVFGLKGIVAVAAKFAIAGAVRMGLGYVHGLFRTPDHNEANDVMDDVAEVVAEKQTAK